MKRIYSNHFWQIHNFLIQILEYILITIFKKDDKFLYNNICQNLTEKKFNSCLIEALIIAEDHRYLNHAGIDIKAILRATWMTIFRRSIQGGSTIEQQFVRTVTRDKELSITRKLREWHYAIKLSKEFSKEEIANSYLEKAYFGWRMNGIEQAMYRLLYSETLITIEQASNVIAMLKYPLPKTPAQTRIDRITRRKNHIYINLSKRRPYERIQ